MSTCLLTHVFEALKPVGQDAHRHGTRGGLQLAVGAGVDGQLDVLQCLAHRMALFQPKRLTQHSTAQHGTTKCSMRRL